ncbi:MAG: RNA 2',3'-cyclic phosphodiesterase [Firmicutes bacterium]|nr:RNA 2',3'-cyclic phosphodiesterase [Bacillota bacterium]
MRAFVAIPIPEAVKDEIRAFYRGIGSVRGVKTVVPENLHITLDFLGDISQREADAFSANLQRLAGKIRPFTVRICGVGAFPSRKDPKILWLGMKNSRPLNELAVKVKAAVDSMDDKKFSPHLTVGRVKYRSDDQKEYFDRFFAQDHKEFGVINVDHIHLMKSDLSGKDPVYTVIRDFKLIGG